MSYIDNIRNKALNAGNSLVTLTGNELTYIMNYIAAQGAIGTGDVMSDGSVPFTGQEDFQSGLKVDTITPSGTSLVSFAAMLGLKVYTTAQEALLVPTAGAVYYNSDLDAIRSYDGAAWNTVGGLSTTGSDAGATASPQVFEQGVELGIDNGVNGELTIYNGDSTGSVLITSTKDKEIKLGNTGNDAEVAINGAAVSGKALATSGAIRGGVFEVVDDTSTITQPGASEMLLTATSGVQISNKLLVDEINGKTVAGTVIVGDAGGANYIKVDDENTRVDLFANEIRINGDPGYSGTFDPTAATSITVVNGIITSVS